VPALSRRSAPKGTCLSSRPWYSGVPLEIMSHKVTLIPGDGIGPEVTQATVRILEATGVKF